MKSFIFYQEAHRYSVQHIFKCKYTLRHVLSAVIKQFDCSIQDMHVLLQPKIACEILQNVELTV
jgi:hypothetical protein